MRAGSPQIPAARPARAGSARHRSGPSTRPGGGGSVLGGRLLLRQSPRVPFLAQALISPDGSILTAVVLRGHVAGNPQISGFFPQNLSVERISIATGLRLHCGGYSHR